VKSAVEKRLPTEKAQKAMQALKTSNKLVLEETYFGKPPVSPPSQPGQPGEVVK
jgi:hypothetical protein